MDGGRESDQPGTRAWLERLAAERAARVGVEITSPADWQRLCDHALGVPWWAPLMAERWLREQTSERSSDRPG